MAREREQENEGRQSSSSKGQSEKKGDRTVREAGRMGGEVRRPDPAPPVGPGGRTRGRSEAEAPPRAHEGEHLGPEGYSGIGKKGGERVRELIEEGKRSAGENVEKEDRD